MSVLAWILVSGVLMSAVALVGALALVLPERHVKRISLPRVGLWRGR